MAAVVTLGALVTRARRLAKMEASTFIDDTEIKSLLLGSVQRLHDRLHGQGQEFVRTTKEMNTTVGQAIYNLPDDFFRLLLLSANRNGDVLPAADPGDNDGDTSGWQLTLSDTDGWLDLWPFELPELAPLLNQTDGSATNARYRLRGTQTRTLGEATLGPRRQLEIRPTPREVYTLRLEYLPTTNVGSTDDGFEIEGLNGFEQIACLEAAIFMLTEEESDTSRLEKMLTREEARLAQVAPAQDATRAGQVVDVLGLLGDPLDTAGVFHVPAWRR